MPDDSFFLVIEGIDGAGKTSIAKRLLQVLRQTHGDDVLLTQEPHDNSLVGAEIRQALRRELQLSPLELAQAFALNRSNHLKTHIEPHLRGEGRIVICDRYMLSSLVYQSRADISMKDVYSMNSRARPPDLTIVLQVSAVEAYHRMNRRKASLELFENDLPSRLKKYQEGIELLGSQGHTIVEVNGNGEVSDVFKLVVEAVKRDKPAWLRIQQPLLLDWNESESAE